MTPRIFSDGAVLREARRRDEPGILASIHALAVYEREPDAVENTVEAITETFFGAAPKAFAHVVEREGEIVGIAIWFLTYSTWTGRHGIWLEDLIVDEVRLQNVGAMVTGTGGHMISLSAKVRKQLGKDIGDPVSVVVARHL